MGPEDTQEVFMEKSGHKHSFSGKKKKQTWHDLLKWWMYWSYQPERPT